MREIKFRAWDGKKMHYQVRFGGVKDGIPLSPSGWDEKFGWTILSGNPVLEIMQFTGLYDKNGKEIYESDICSTLTIDGTKSKDIIKYIEGGFYCVDATYVYEAELLGSKYFYEIEVIGNIYENPELIRKKNGKR